MYGNAYLYITTQLGNIEKMFNYKTKVMKKYLKKTWGTSAHFSSHSSSKEDDWAGSKLYGATSPRISPVNQFLLVNYEAHS